MTPVIVEGIYRDGHVELPAPPEGIAEGTRVRVTFLDPEIADEERRAAGDRLFARFKEGIAFGGPPYPKRDELHDRAEQPGPGTG